MVPLRTLRDSTRRKIIVAAAIVLVVTLGANILFMIRRSARDSNQELYDSILTQMGEAGRIHLALTDIDRLLNNPLLQPDLRNNANILAAAICEKRESYELAEQYLEHVKLEGRIVDVQDYVNYLQGRIFWKLYERSSADSCLQRAMRCFQRVLESPRSPMQRAAWVDYVRCCYTRHDYAYVETVTDDLVTEVQRVDRGAHAEMLYMIGNGWLQRGQVEKGSACLGQLWRMYPASGWAERAEATLRGVSMTRIIRFPALSVSDILDVYDSVLTRRNVGDQYLSDIRKQLDVLAEQPPPSTVERLTLTKAKVCYRTREYRDEAVGYFATASQSLDPDIRVQAVSYLIRRAAETYDFERIQDLLASIASPRYMTSRSYEVAVYDAGFPFMRKKSYSDAAAVYRRVLLKSRGENTNFDNALWRLHWCYYHLGQYDQALKVLGELKKSDKWTEYATFWMAYVYQKLGEHSVSRTLFKELLADRGLTYYGALAKEILKQEFDNDTTIDIAPVTFVTPTVGAIDDAGRNARFRFLRENGLFEFAATELLEYLKEAGVSNTSNIDNWRPYGSELAKLYYASGNYIKAGRYLSQAHEENVLKGGKDMPDWFWRIYYPVLHTDVIRRAAMQYGVSDTFLYAFIRQESYFEPFAVSAAGAVGVMQIMPATGRSIFREIGSTLGLSTYDSSLLYRPEVNIPMGVYYLKRQFDEVEKLVAGQQIPDTDKRAIVYSLVIASYNAGMSRAKRWLKETRFDNQQELVDQIDIEETRRYVKLVLKHEYLYSRYLHGSGDHR